MAESNKDYKRGSRISARRKELGLTQDELAFRIGIGRQALSAIENGGEFKIQTLERLVSALDISEKFIMQGIEESKSELINEVINILSDMNELQIRQSITMLKAMKNAISQV